MHLMHMIRTLHIHLSMATLGVVLLFAGTGLVLGLGHKWEMEIPAIIRRTALIATEGMIGAKPEQVEGLRRELAVSGSLESSDESDAQQLVLTFVRPGSRTEVTIERSSRKAQIRTEDRGTMGFLSDLHRNKSTRPGWQWLVPATAGLLLMLTLTGVVLWWNHPTRRRWGAIWIVVGIAVAVGALVL